MIFKNESKTMQIFHVPLTLGVPSHGSEAPAHDSGLPGHGSRVSGHGLRAHGHGSAVPGHGSGVPGHCVDRNFTIGSDVCHGLS